MKKDNVLQNHQLKRGILFILLISLSTAVFAHSGNNEFTHKAVDGGIGLGTVIAVVASWSRNKSILWAIIHGIFSWFYVIYFAITRES